MKSVSYILGAIAFGCLCWLAVRVGVSKYGPGERNMPVVSKEAGGKSVQPGDIESYAGEEGVDSSGKLDERPVKNPGDENDGGAVAGESLSGEDAREHEEARLVDAFDALTDKWMEPSSNGVSMEDVESFSQQFRRLPAARRGECLQRALNLLPDENVMLLAGILMDKTIAQELVTAVYNDILNRDEAVKKPILQTIFKDKTHPCWADTAWILDVTGELPEKK